MNPLGSGKLSFSAIFKLDRFSVFLALQMYLTVHYLVLPGKFLSTLLTTGQVASLFLLENHGLVPPFWLDKISLA